MTDWNIEVENRTAEILRGTPRTDTVRSSSTGEKECAACGRRIDMRTRLCVDPVRAECVVVTVHKALEVEI